jgi:hypothetical protein
LVPLPAIGIEIEGDGARAVDVDLDRPEHLSARERPSP